MLLAPPRVKRRICVPAVVALTLVLAAAAPVRADGTPPPAPSATPSPAASPSTTSSSPPREGWQASLDGMSSFIDQATNGPGTLPPEGAQFAAGFPLSPTTPYDSFSSAPTTPGVASISQLVFAESYASKHLRAQVSAGLAYVQGSVTNASYWTESLMPLLNPHLGSDALHYSVAFPTHAGQDDTWIIGGSLPLSLALGGTDGSWQIKSGWFDLTQTDRFVFVQPALTNVTPAITVQPPESLGNGPPNIDGWPSPPPGLPLNGIDFTLHRGAATVELSDASLPALPGTRARITIGSLVLDRGGGTRFSTELLHVVTGGDLLSSTTLFGANPRLNPGPQGPLPTSELGGQIQTIAGIRGAFHIARALDATLEFGRAWYTAQHVFAPGTEKPGGFYHAALSRSVGRATGTAEVFRFEPRYAAAILPYGAPENIWSAAWSWPGVWLKSTYQLADNTVAGSNREGYRLRYALDRGPLELHASFAAFHQIEPASVTNAHLLGFVEGFFLPQQPGFESIGRQKQFGAWIAWHPSFGNLEVDYVEDMLHRAAAASQPPDAVSEDIPQAVISYGRALSKTATVALGVGRYAIRGTFAQGNVTNVDFSQNVIFAGGQFAESKQAMILLQLRHHSLVGIPSISAGPPPNYSGSLILVEQRFHM